MKHELSRLLLAAAALSAACWAAAEGTGARVAQVNGVPVAREDYQRELTTSMDYWAKTNPQALKDPANAKKIQETTLEELINRELLDQEGVRLDTHFTPRELDTAVAEVKARFGKDDSGRTLDAAAAEQAFNDEMKKEGITYAQWRNKLGRQLLVRKVIEQEVRPEVSSPGDREARAYFDRIVAYLKSGSSAPPKDMDAEDGEAFVEAAKQVKALSSERVRVSRILLKVPPGAPAAARERAAKTAADLKKRLDQGEDFASMAQAESEDAASASRGGDIGYVLRGVAEPAIEKAVFSMNVGQTSAPIFNDLGCQILRVTEKRDAQEPDFSAMKSDLIQFLYNQRYSKALSGFIAGLKSRAVIERYQNGIAEVVAAAPAPPAPEPAAAPEPAPVPAPAADSGGALSKSDIEALIAKAVADRSEAKPAPAAKAAHSDVDAPNYHEPENPDDYALVVGVEKYESLPDASYAARDAEAVRAHLLALGYPARNIISLVNSQASRSKLAAYLEEWLPRRVKPDSRVFVYFSGHGSPNPETGQAYLVPSDGDPEFLEKTAYPTQRLYEQLGALKAKQVLVALDTCFSGIGGRSVLPKGIRPLVSKVDTGALGSDRMIAFSASSGEQISGVIEEQGHGAFTYFLLKGLNGPAAGKNGAVTVQSLYDYLLPKVQDSARNQNRSQTPQLILPSGGKTAPVVLR